MVALFVRGDNTGSSHCLVECDTNNITNNLTDWRWDNSRSRGATWGDLCVMSRPCGGGCQRALSVLWGLGLNPRDIALKKVAASWLSGKRGNLRIKYFIFINPRFSCEGGGWRGQVSRGVSIPPTQSSDLLAWYLTVHRVILLISREIQYHLYSV